MRHADVERRVADDHDVGRRNLRTAAAVDARERLRQQAVPVVRRRRRTRRT